VVRIAFLGLGTMGEPMARRLVADGRDLTVWNRGGPARYRLTALGARAAASPAEAFSAADVVILMLANGDVIDEVLGRHADGFDVEVEGRVVVNMGTVAPAYSRALHAQLGAGGALFAEAPVSGSKAPAQAGQLVAMMAGDAAALDVVEELLGPLTTSVVRCGQVPQALETKLAVNTFLITLVTGLAEAVAYAERRGVDLALLRQILDAGPMASTVSRGKLAKLLDGDLSAAASIGDVLYNSRLILEGAAQASAAVPLLTSCEELLAETEALGAGDADMIAVVDAFRARGDGGA
jgi:3-hydroxyisobutyrate dehydrogenase